MHALSVCRQSRGKCLAAESSSWRRARLRHLRAFPGPVAWATKYFRAALTRPKILADEMTFEAVPFWDKSANLVIVVIRCCTLGVGDGLWPLEGRARRTRFGENLQHFLGRVAVASHA